ncbi:class I SAM-dependent methyltransferase [Serratia fonticola]|uniref:class I SAM-dependent methyltransferase n=1 Tax=Serratia fonticola TaxID=47917 RepID=UPI003BB63F7C
MISDEPSVFDKEYIQFSSNYLTNERTQHEVNNIVAYFGDKRISEILDLGCGTGRIAIKLAERGYNVTGLDWNKTAINLAKENDKKSLVNFIHEDYHELNYKTKFNCILSWYTSFGYFSDKENNELLNKVFSALKPDGFFILDHPNRDRILKAFQKHIVEEYNDNIMIDERSFNPLNGFLYQNRTFVIKGNIRKLQYKIRLYTPSELITMLTRLGFREVAVKDEKNDGFSLDSKRMVIIARK